MIFIPGPEGLDSRRTGPSPVALARPKGEQSINQCLWPPLELGSVI